MPTRSLRLVFTVFDLFLGLFGSLALTVASLGIINTLVMAILERRREIGVLKALGATDRDVRSLFFAEAGAMGFLGGISGVALGWLIGASADLGHHHLFTTPGSPGSENLLRPVVAGRRRHRFCSRRQLASGPIPCRPCRPLEPRRGFAL